MFKIEQIGNGGGLNLNATNTSFILHEDIKPILLIDCGFNVPAKLIELGYIKDINSVYITHAHADHMGGLESLLYYRYYVCGLKTKIYMVKDVYTDVGGKFFDRFNTELDGSELVNVDMYSLKVISNFETLFCIDEIKSVNFSLLRGQHGNVDNYGLIIDFERATLHGGVCVITGDTIATKHIATKLEELAEIRDRVVVYHDRTEWDNPVNSTHACDSQINAVYNDLLTNDKVEFMWVHDNNEIPEDTIFD